MKPESQPDPIDNSPPADPINHKITPISSLSVSDQSPQIPQQHASPLQPAKKSFKLGIQTLLSVVLFFGFVFSAAALLNSFVFQSYYVDGSSMTPSLHNQDRLIISKVEKTAAAIEHKTYIPQRGQIVVLESSVSELTAQKGEQIIKRVIGLPGDSIHIEQGVVTVYNRAHPNGFDVNASLHLNLDPTYTSGTVDYSVPTGSIFVMGDNRGLGGSFDSRIFGTVTSDKIIGRLWVRILPLNQTGVF